MIACTASLCLLLAPQDAPRADISHHGAALGHDLVLDFDDREGRQVSPLLCAIATVGETLRCGSYGVDATAVDYRYRATAEDESWCAELATIGVEPRRPCTVTVRFRAGVPMRMKIEP